MKRIVFLIMFFFVFCSFASELRLFKDKAVYYPDNPSAFLGFNKNISVFCDNVSLPVYKGVNAPDNCYLAPFYKEFRSLSFKGSVLNKKLLLFDKVFDSLQFKTNQEAVAFLKKSSLYAEEFAKVKTELNKVSVKLAKVKDKIGSCAPSFYPFYCDLPKNFKSFRMEFSGIRYSVKNKLKISDDLKTVSVKKEIKLKNSSGVDIKADDLYILNIVASTYFRPISFNPWVVREGNFYPVRKTMAKKAERDFFMEAAPAPVSADKSVSQIDSRIYLLKAVNLPSNGVEKSFSVNEKKVPVTFKRVVYPYTDLRVYKEYSFNLPFEIDNNKWTVYSGKEIYSNVTGRLDKDANVYRIFAGVDYGIEVSRDKILNFKEKQGFFNKTKVVKDGYEIKLKNLTKKNKTVTVVDRVPVSSDKEIKVKDLVVSGVKDYKVNRKGMLKMNIDLNAGEVKKIRVEFTIEYPEDKKIVY